jgi:hypothetical protein
MSQSRTLGLSSIRRIVSPTLTDDSAAMGSFGQSRSAHFWQSQTPRRANSFVVIASQSDATSEPATLRESPRKLMRALALLDKWVRFAKNGALTSLLQAMPEFIADSLRRNWVRSAGICRRPSKLSSFGGNPSTTQKLGSFGAISSGELGSFVAFSPP